MNKVIAIIALLVFGLASSSQAQTTWGINNTRTDYRDNAGLQGNNGAISGFYETNNPSNFPGGASNWWHLLDVRHDNPNNNYAMQFAGSFFDQDLYFRKTNNNPAQAWSKVIMATDGKVGIGTNAADELFDVKGASVFGPLAERVSLGSGSLGFNRKVANGQIFDPAYFAYQMQHTRSNTQGNDYLAFQVYRPDWSQVTPYALTINSSGNVGIGTPSPDAALAVNGTIHFKEVKVDLSGFPDYVFKPSYHLLSLKKVKTYIDKHGHLPEIPSAANVAKEGLSLGEMNRLLVKKVEELTLYLIEKDKKDKLLQKQLKWQQEQIDRLNSQAKNKK